MDKLIGALAALLLLGPGAEAADEPRETNKQTVIAFYEAAINHKDFAAAEKYLGSRYTQHNPNAADGPQGLKKFLDFLRDKYPAAHSEIRQVFAHGEYVILHVHAVREPHTPGSAIVRIFQVQDGKNLEQWDGIQPITH